MPDEIEIVDEAQARALDSLAAKWTEHYRSIYRSGLSGDLSSRGRAVKFDRTLADKAAFVCARRKITLADYLSEMCRARIERDFLRETAGQGYGE